MPNGKILTSKMTMIDPLDLQPVDLDPMIAIHAISMLCRYGGQCKAPYFVGEHTIHLYWAVPAHLRRAALLHDFPEGFGLVDVVHPVKLRLPQYMEIDEDATKRVFARFDEPWEHMAELKQYDRRICQDEMMQIFDEPYDIGLEPVGITVQFMDWWFTKSALTELCRMEGIIQ